jgi:transcription elongation factor Elf1
MKIGVAFVTAEPRTTFHCQNCNTEYKVVRVEADSSADRTITCRTCGAPFNCREGRFVLKYFRIGPRSPVRPPLRSVRRR